MCKIRMVRTESRPLKWTKRTNKVKSKNAKEEKKKKKNRGRTVSWGDIIENGT